jgi:hypothetical protein
LHEVGCSVGITVEGSFKEESKEAVNPSVRRMNLACPKIKLRPSAMLPENKKRCCKEPIQREKNVLPSTLLPHLGNHPCQVLH